MVSNTVIKATSNAKINLRLKVLGLREDGYHLLSMLNCMVGLSDSIQIELLNNRTYLSGQNTLDPSITFFSRELLDALNNPEKNIAVRASRLFHERFMLAGGSKISIKKRIPAGAGLGGGSSNAAAVLSSLFTIYTELGKLPRSDYSKRALLELALELGADVPFFLYGGLSVVSGVGEIVEPIRIPVGNDIEGYRCLLIWPHEHLSTQEIYKLSRANRKIGFLGNDNRLSEFISQPTINSVMQLISNDLEPFVVSRSTLVQEILARLRELPEICASITGSGSAIFVFERPGFTLDHTAVSNALMGLDIGTFSTVLRPTLGPNTSLS